MYFLPTPFDPMMDIISPGDDQSTKSFRPFSRCPISRGSILTHVVASIMAFGLHHRPPFILCLSWFLYLCAVSVRDHIPSFRSRCPCCYFFFGCLFCRAHEFAVARPNVPSLNGHHHRAFLFLRQPTHFWPGFPNNSPNNHCALSFAPPAPRLVSFEVLFPPDFPHCFVPLRAPPVVPH